MITFKKGKYKILCNFNPQDKDDIVVREVDGLLFDYNDISFGMSKYFYDNTDVLKKSDTYIISDISTGLSIRIYPKSKNEVETLLEEHIGILDVLNNTNNERLNEARRIINKSKLGGLLNKINKGN